jgi:uncharacterized damage-inducible protein DinB
MATRAHRPADGEGAALARELRTLTHGEAWHGPAFAELLEGVSPEAASARPIPGAHTIWELVLHVTAWTKVFRRRLEGAAVEEPEEGDFPAPPSPSAAGWGEARKALFDAHDALTEHVSRLGTDDLRVKIGGRDYDAQFQVRAAIAHSVYHAGQIGLLRRGVLAR